MTETLTFAPGRFGPYHPTGLRLRRSLAHGETRREAFKCHLFGNGQIPADTASRQIKAFD